MDNETSKDVEDFIAIQNTQQQYNPPPLYFPDPNSVICIPDEIGESDSRSSLTCSDLSFHQSCVHIHRTPDLARLLSPVHIMAELLQHFHTHGDPMTTDSDMEMQDAPECLPFLHDA